MKPEQTSPGAAHVAVARVAGEYRLHANVAFAAGDVLFAIEGREADRPSRFSLQVDRDIHIEVREGATLEEQLDTCYWRFLNHSCDPNVVIRGRNVLALRPIQAMEELAFNYNTTEFDMAEPFSCRCEAAHCTGTIRGFRHLSRAEQERLRPLLAGYLIEYLGERSHKRGAGRPAA
jgi:hypothetical protein